MDRILLVAAGGGPGVPSPRYSGWRRRGPRLWGFGQGFGTANSTFTVNIVGGLLMGLLGGLAGVPGRR